MVTEDFLDFKDTSNTFINMNKFTDRESVNVLKIRSYSVRKGDPCVHIQYSIDGPTTDMNLFQVSRKTKEVSNGIHPKQLYTTRLSLSDEKSQIS